MAGKKTKKATTHREDLRRNAHYNRRIYIGAFTFLVLTIYLVGYMVAFMMRPKVKTETVTYGTIDVPKSYGGLVIRNEVVVYTTAEGVPTYHYAEYDKVKKDAVVSSIKDEQKAAPLESLISDLDNQILQIQDSRLDISLFKDEIDKVDEQIHFILSDSANYILSGDMDRVYEMKNRVLNNIDLKKQMLLSESTGSIRSYVDDRLSYSQQLENTIVSLTAPVSGIVSFAMDGKETEITLETMETLTKQKIEEKIETTVRLSNDSVESETALFKIIPSNTWYVAAYIENDQIQGWDIGMEKPVTVANDKVKKELQMTIESIQWKDKESLVILYTDRYLIDFLDQRNITIEIQNSMQRGLKVPQEAIVEKRLVKIPTDYIQDSAVLVTNGITEQEEPVIVSFRQDGYSYVHYEIGGLRLGDTIKNADGETYILEELVMQKGVYVVNSAIAEFKRIGEVLAENEEYAIINPDVSGVRNHDKIASDASTIEENQRIY